MALSAQLAEFRKAHPVFRRRRWFQGRAIRGTGVTDIAWFSPDGTEMSDDDRNSGFAKSMAVFLNGQAIPDPDPRGERVVNDSFLLLFNAHHEPLEFTLPAKEWGEHWVVMLDTDDLPLLHVEPTTTTTMMMATWEPGWGEGEPVKSGDHLEVGARSVVVLRRVE